MRKSLYQHMAKLAILDLLVETGSFRGASVRAHVTQSALSQTVSSLEAIFGQPLLVREAGVLRPTAACIALLTKVRPILRDLDAIADDLASPTAAFPALTSLDLGIYDSLAVRIVPALARSLRQKFPEIHLNIKTGRSGELAHLVRKGELCMAMITEIDGTAGLPTHVIGEDNLGVYTSARLGLSAREALATLGLGSLAAPKEGYPAYFSRYLRALKLPKPAVLSESFEALRAMAADGAIASILPARVARRRHAELLQELDLGIPSRYGRHDIVLVSQRNCDKQESAFLAEEMRRMHQDAELS